MIKINSPLVLPGRGRAVAVPRLWQLTQRQHQLRQGIVRAHEVVVVQLQQQRTLVHVHVHSVIDTLKRKTLRVNKNTASFELPIRTEIEIEIEINAPAPKQARASWTEPEFAERRLFYARHPARLYAVTIHARTGHWCR